MPRYKLTIEYDGSAYCGWQRQHHSLSVQQALEQAFFAFTGEEVMIYGSGRTDAGVHAFAQIAHVDLSKDWDSFKITNAANAHLRQEDIVILGTELVDDEFHARFSAIERHYVYRIICRRARLALENNRAWNVKVPLNVTEMNDAAKVLEGKHDFTTFRSTECQAKSPLKTLHSLTAKVVNQSDTQSLIEIRASAPSFLHNQVRSLVGSLKLVGEGKWSRDDLQSALSAHDRAACGPVAPAHGLYLAKVDYPG